MLWGVSTVSHFMQSVTYLRNQLKQMEEYFLNNTTQAIERVHRQFRQVEGHEYDQPLQTLGSVHQGLVQVARLAYPQLIQEGEYVQLLPEFHVLK